jgi:hypothetical protein
MDVETKGLLRLGAMRPCGFCYLRVGRIPISHVHRLCDTSILANSGSLGAYRRPNEISTLGGEKLEIATSGETHRQGFDRIVTTPARHNVLDYGFGTE